MSSIFGSANSNVVNLTGNQTITGSKTFERLNQPIIYADNTIINPSEISFLEGLASNAQQQIDGINIVLTGLTALEQALQAIEPAPNATTVQFNDSLILSDNNLSLTMTPDTITASDGVTISTVNGSIAINSPSDQVNVNAVNGFVVNSLSTISTTTLNGITIVLTDGTTTNTIDKNGITTRNTNANLTHYLNFSDSSSTGTGSVQKTAGLSCNPSTSTISATTFVGTASSATNVIVTSDNTAGTYYIPFAKTTGSGGKPLFIDDATGPLSYNPSTSTVSASAYTITGTPATAGVASTFGQVGLVYLQTLTASITGAATAVDFNLSNCFNSTYQNYRIVLIPSTQIAFTAYPSYSLKAWLYTGTAAPTVASVYGNETTSSNAGATVAPVYLISQTMATNPILFAASGIVNKQVVFEVKNVGYAYTQTQQMELLCKSVYNNPGIQGVSDRTIICSGSGGTTITGLTITQTAISAGNNMTLNAVVYGYNLI